MQSCLITADTLDAGHGHGGPGRPPATTMQTCKNGDNVCLLDDGGDGDGYDGGAPGLSAWASRERPWLGGGL